jgi:DNA helicase-2/ATP-dependent DNA helicase PcrA
VTAVRCLDERDEADFVVEQLLARRSSGNSLRDFAIVYRTNSQSRALEEAMRKRAVHYRLVGTVRFYDRREVRDLMSYLKLIANPSDNEAFRRAVSVPKRGLGETTIESLSIIASEAGVPMLAAAQRPELLTTIRPAARTALAEFRDAHRQVR